MIIKHPKWRVASFTVLPPAQIAELLTGVHECIRHFPFYNQIADIEIVGSYVFGCAKPHSDIDINIQMSGKPAQRAAYNIWRQPQFRTEFLIKRKLLRQEQGLYIDICCGAENSKEYVPVYSVNESRFYNWNANRREEIRAKYIREAEQFIIYPKPAVEFNIDRDPYSPEEIQAYKELYGSEYLWLP